MPDSHCCALWELEGTFVSWLHSWPSCIIVFLIFPWLQVLHPILLTCLWKFLIWFWLAAFCLFPLPSTSPGTSNHYFDFLKAVTWMVSSELPKQTCVTLTITSWRVLLAQNLQGHSTGQLPSSSIQYPRDLMNTSTLVCWKFCMFVYYVWDGSHHDQSGKGQILLWVNGT